MLPRLTIASFDTWLHERALHLDAVVVGGSALALLGVTDRPTRDVDVLAPTLSEEIVQAAREFAAHSRRAGVPLAEDWLNNGPMLLCDVLPDGWRLDLQTIFQGAALRLTTLGRADLLKTKLFALCDRGTDLADCLALAPTQGELEDAMSWLLARDTNPMWPEHAAATLHDLRRRLGHGL